MTFEQLVSIQGVLMRAFFVKDRRNRVVALGAVPTSTDAGYCQMKTKRGELDESLVTAVSKLTGMRVRQHLWHKGRKGCPRVLGVIQDQFHLLGPRMKTASWVIENATGRAILETFNPKTAAAINTAKYTAVPILDYLVSINGQGGPSK